MRALQAIRALGPIDARSIHRDAFLRWMIGIPIVVALLFRWAIPALGKHLLAAYGFDLSGYHGLIASFLLLLTPGLVGMVIGFLLLDQRDDHTLTALQVTPLTLNGYLLYRLLMPMALSAVMTLLIYPIAALVQVPWLIVLGFALSAAPFAAIYALFLAAFAANKVQGFALMKAIGAVLWPPIVAYFVDSNWQLLCGIVPTYWPVKAFWLWYAGQSGAIIYLAIGLCYQLLLVVLLLRRFNTVMQR